MASEACSAGFNDTSKCRPSFFAVLSFAPLTLKAEANSTIKIKILKCLIGKRRREFRISQTTFIIKCF